MKRETNKNIQRQNSKSRRAYFGVFQVSGFLTRPIRPGPSAVGPCQVFGRFQVMGGFTLIELLVYVALVGVAAVATTNTIITLNRTIAVFRIERRLTTSAELAMRRMAREIRLAQSVYASSTLAVSPGVLSVASVESETDATPKDVLVQVDSGALTLRRGSADALVFTGNGVTVSRLVFWKMDNADISQAVKIEMTLTTTSGGITRSGDYFMTTLLRGAY